MDKKEQDYINYLIDKVIADDNLWRAYAKDGVTVYQLKGHMEKYSQPLKKS